LHYDDGQYIAIDPNDWRTVYSGTNRFVPARSRSATPIHRAGFRRRRSQVGRGDTANSGGLNPFRVNWTTPFICAARLPRHHYGANHSAPVTSGGVMDGN
jgi:hypothetical protein